LTASECLHVSARYLEPPIVDLVMKMLTHERLLDATRVVELVEEQDQALDKQWSLRLERARFPETLYARSVRFAP